jgi:hypothetical protein
MTKAPDKSSGAFLLPLLEKSRVLERRFLLAGVFGFSIRFREIGVVVLQHLILIAMA